MKPPDLHAVYDNIGNLERSETLSNDGGITNYYGSNPLNQYTNITGSTTNLPTYDDDGNMLTNGDWTYSWNGENRMITASNSSMTATYNYDYMGRRFSKTVSTGDTCVRHSGQTCTIDIDSKRGEVAEYYICQGHGEFDMQELSIT